MLTPRIDASPGDDAGNPPPSPAPGFFERLAQAPACGARRGRLWTAHGPVDTPVFMPVGTQAGVKSLDPCELRALRVPILLGNTYHLMIRPGMEVIEACGGLHRFMGWEGPMLTDSGGFQVFSLARLRKIRPDGVTFQSHVDGRALFLGPVESMAMQRVLGADIAMCFDECPPWPCTAQEARRAVDYTLAWARICREQPRAPGQLCFGIVQGGEHLALRRQCADALVAMAFDGYAIGGVSVGEPPETMLHQVAQTLPHLPEDRPRYVMGLGEPEQMADCVALGVDMFDCVMPTRHARNGSAFTRLGRISVKAGRYRLDTRPVEEGCECFTCTRFSRAYIRHLLNVNEMLGPRLLTFHNLHVMMRLMEDMRDAIQRGGFREWHAQWLARRREAQSD